MHQENPSILQNKTCFACKFYNYYNEQTDYGCSIKGCIESSKFKEYSVEEFCLSKKKERKSFAI